MKLPENKSFKIGRNPSYRASVAGAFKLGIWWAPTAFWFAIRSPLCLILLSAAMALLNVALLGLRMIVVTVLQVTLIVSGLFGFLRVEVPADQQG